MPKKTIVKFHRSNHETTTSAFDYQFYAPIDVYEMTDTEYEESIEAGSFENSDWRYFA